MNWVREQLTRRGLRAILLVNFTVSNGVRQVDLVIVTSRRCINVELKALDQRWPVIACVNGFWRQRLSDGSDRMFDKNFYIQARDETFGLSDAMAELAAKQAVPPPRNGNFFRDIETVVCLDPKIPSGSVLPEFSHVKVIGLDDLVDRLATPGPGLPYWTIAHWNKLISHLGLYNQSDDLPQQQRSRANQAILDDYGRQFLELGTMDLNQIVTPTAIVDGSPGTVSPSSVAEILETPRRRVLLSGPSGIGKSHLARHTALELTRRGQLVIWVPADDYDKNRLSRSLSRSVAPYSIASADALMATAAECGVGIIVMIDGLENCLHQEELLTQLHALQNRYPASILASIVDEDRARRLAADTVMRLEPPTAAERAQIAAVHGDAEGVFDFSDYRTRYDVAVGAQVVAELPSGASATEALSAYVRKLAPTESARAGLRCLADTMDAEVRTTLPADEAMLTLRRWCKDSGLNPTVIDQITGSRLVSIRQSRLRFRHEQLARFLAAEHLVLQAADGQGLARLLDVPARHDLRGYAVALERVPDRQYAAIRNLADQHFVASAVLGQYGEATSQLARADVIDMLTHAAATASAATLYLPDGSMSSIFGVWHGVPDWTPTERALLAAAGRCARSGQFLDEIGAVMDATDTALHAAMTALRDSGHPAAITAVLASTFVGIDRRSDPAAAIICHAVRHSRIFGTNQQVSQPLATIIWRGFPSSYSRLFLASLLSQPLLHSEDAINLPGLVEAGLAAGGYHLRLELLYAAQFACRDLNSSAHQQMINILNSYTPASDDWGTNSTLIEALACYDQITPMSTLEDIQRSIAEILDDEHNPDNWRLARGVVSSVFEDDRIIGPYGDAVDSLPQDERLKLLAMSVLVPDPSFFGTTYAVRQIAQPASGTDDLVVRALARWAIEVPDDAFRQEHVAAHLLAVRGWAVRYQSLPPSHRTDLFAATWRLFDELLMPAYAQSTDSTHAEELWENLTTEPTAVYSIVILYDIHHADVAMPDDPQSVDAHVQLLDAYPDQILKLAEWALGHRQTLMDISPHIARELNSYLMYLLSEVGTSQTARLLRDQYINDPEFGRCAVKALHAINARTHL